MMERKTQLSTKRTVKTYIRSSSSSSFRGLLRILLSIGALAIAAILTWGVFQVVLARRNVTQAANFMAQDAELETTIEGWTEQRTTLTDYLQKLEAVPNFPLFPYESAQATVSQLKDQITAVDLEIKAHEHFNLALQKASQASNLVQDPPHPISLWKDAQGLWQASIAELQLISAESNLYSQAQEKLGTYQNNLSAIQQQYQLEETALNQFVEVTQSATPLKANINRLIETRSTEFSFSNLEGSGRISYVNNTDSELRQIRAEMTNLIELYRTIPANTYHRDQIEDEISDLNKDIALINKLLAGGCDTESCPIPPSSVFSQR